MRRAGASAIGVMLALTASPAAAGPPGSSSLEQPLSAGATVERRLGAEEIHSYGVEVPAGRYLGIRVEQRGLDVVVSIRDPAGSVVRRHDSPCGDVSVESVSLLSGRASRYRIEISSFSRLGYQGDYVLNLDGPRPQRSKDSARIAAEKALEKAEALFDEGTASSFAAAIPGYAEAARRFAPIDRRQEAIALFGIAQADRSLGRTDRAIQDAERSLAAARRAGDRGLESLSLGHLAYNRFLREGRAAALEPLRQAIAIESSLRIRSTQYANLAYFHWLLGEYEDALFENQQTRQIARSAGDRRGEALALKNLAQVYWSLGLPRRALAFGDQALEVIHGYPEGLQVEAHVLMTRGRIWQSLGDEERSLADLKATLALRRRLGDGQGEALALTKIAEIQYNLGDPRGAGENARPALRLSRAAQDLRAQTQELILLGRIKEAEGGSAEAAADWSEALAISRSTADRAGESSAELAMARAARGRGRLEEALAHAERGFDLAESLRGEVPLPELRASYSAPGDRDRQLLTEILIERDQKKPGGGFAERAFESAERTRARALAEAITEGRLAPNQRVPPTLRAKQRETNARIAFLQRRLAEAPAAEGSRLAAELASAETDFDRAVLEIRRTNPRLAALRYPRPLKAPQALALLAPDEAMISYALTGDGLFAFLLTPVRLTLFRLPADARILTARVENFVELLSRGDETTDRLADRLSEELFEPLRREIPAGIRRLVIVPDGPLHSLPFEALPVSSGAVRRLLIEDFAVSYAPSATVLAAVTAERSSHGADREDLIAFADPAPPAPASTQRGAAGGWAPADLARLPAARREVAAIARYASPGSKVYTDAEASESRLKRERLDRYRVLHFATHGLLDLENPGRSALLLAASGDGRDDGLLETREISELDLASELVVLSGCETARGQALAGEGVQSLARAFFLAGTRSVVASLWRVRDEATERLMSAFYRRLSEGEPRDVALRRAKHELLRQPETARPRDWASFVLIGEGPSGIPLSPGGIRPRS